MNLWLLLILALFLLWVLILWVGLGIVSALSPEVALIILSSLGFGLFAFRLLMAYGTVLLTAEKFFKGEAIDKRNLAAKGGKPEAKSESLSVLLGLILASVEPYRYAYYLAFAFLLMLTLAFAVAPALKELTSSVEALFWGAALTTYFVWSFETLASSALSEVARRENET